MIKGTENLPIGNLIAQRMPFVVPIYQRTYAWEPDNVSDFCSDILKLYESRRTNPAKPGAHFFGGLVSVDKFAAATLTGRQFEVVDGQQRLATFFLVLGLLVKHFKMISKDAEAIGDKGTAAKAVAHAEDTEAKYLCYTEVDGEQRRQRVRLTLSKADNDFFFQLISSDKAPTASRDSHENLKDAQKIIEKQLLTGNPPFSNPKDKLEHLLVLQQCLLDDCHVIHIVSDNRTEAYRLFSVLNDRGKTLSDGDLLRARTLELLEGFPDQQNDAERNWDLILSGDEAEVSSLLRAYYPSHTGERAPVHDLYDTYNSRFLNYASSPVLSLSDAGNIQSWVAQLKIEAGNFQSLADGDWPYENPTVAEWDQSRLSRLVKVLRHELCLPLLMAASYCLDESKFNEIVQLLERFTFRYITIVGAHPSSVSDRYYKHAKNIRANPSAYLVSSLRDDLKQLIDREAPDSLFEPNLVGKLSYSASSQRKSVIKYFLTMIEDHYKWLVNGGSGQPKPSRLTVFDLKQVSIEHIYPHNAPTIDGDLEPLKQTIGNLSIWAPTDNKAANNDSFDVKRPRYAASNIALNRELSTLPGWTKASYEARQKKLIEWAMKLFAL
jgi:hypothetical protein